MYTCGSAGECIRAGVWGSAVPLEGMGAAGCLYVRDRTTGYSTSGRSIAAGPIHLTGFKAQVSPSEDFYDGFCNRPCYYPLSTPFYCLPPTA